MSTRAMPEPEPLTNTKPAPPRWVRALVRPVAGRPALLIELFIFWMFFQYFNFAQEHIRGPEGIAMRNAHWLIDLETKLHLDFEPHVNHALASAPLLAKAAGYFYGFVLAGVPIALAWCWWVNPQGVRRLRRLLIATTLPSLLIFWLVPMAPPRFAMHGIIDINALYNILGGRLARDPSKSANLYAAMPSLHCAWASWVGYSLWSSYRRRRPRKALLAWIFPLVTYWDVVATGNHFVLDVVGGISLFLLALLGVKIFSRADERVWQGSHHERHESDGYDESEPRGEADNSLDHEGVAPDRAEGGSSGRVGPHIGRLHRRKQMLPVAQPKRRDRVQRDVSE